jgi:hypothetical protein
MESRSVGLNGIEQGLSLAVQEPATTGRGVRPVARHVGCSGGVAMTIGTSTSWARLGIVALLAVGIGCGSGSGTTTGGGGKGGSTSTGTGGGGGVGVKCTVTGSACTSNAECCSQSCDPVAKTCASSVSSCSGPGSSCAVNTDCCNLQCDTASGTCSNTSSCTADNAACTGSSACCSGTCTGGKCQPLNTTCLTAGNPCTATTGDGGLAGGCCSGLCSGGKCVLGSSFCIQPGDVCARDLDCCGGLCSIASGATQGVCTDIATTGTGQCTHDGVLCNGCGNCCSRNCGPWALTGVDVCQPGLGCKIINSLCTTDSECCGNSTGQVHCTLSTSGNMSIGVCSTNLGTQVPGGICRLTGGNNACSNAQSDCTCAVDPKAACCAYDTLGLPRCLGSGTCADGGAGVFSGTSSNCCRKAGDTCNTAAECCGLSPCVPDSTGTYRCLTTTPNDGGIVCVQSGGTCTATGDCCTGLVCNIVGGGTGTCGPPPTPPPADAGVCALYGQACNANTPCCGGVQCTYSPTNTPCAAGNVGCTCYSPITIGFVGGTP